MEIRFFKTPADLRKWFEKNHDRSTEQWIGFYKKSSGKPSITWPQSVDEALCFGWIDGLRKSIDDEAYKIRFTPRRKSSIWSAVNIMRANELIDLGLMNPSGLAEFEKRDEKRAGLCLRAEERRVGRGLCCEVQKEQEGVEFFRIESTRLPTHSDAFCDEREAGSNPLEKARHPHR